MDVRTALSAFETAEDALAAADTGLETAKGKEADALGKYQAAQEATVTASNTDSEAASRYNDAVNELIDALTGTLRVVFDRNTVV